ncbi:DUF4893 domain-containing protein [Sphingomonas sp.]|uniref:DUF4893 domain-containing protein n=1 Tax=Sphingomonas sp. TaxID=28214 RepID=UPI0025E10F77|nr:DUF4893 domain-containing protein [Sphingomonas sp.]MBV9528318.1 DUF4893 domain-containing protein [Sphingomonas sp.]
MRLAPLLVGLVTLAGCSTIERSTSMFPNRSRDWRLVATQDDQKRLRDWRSSFVDAIAAARGAGQGPAIDREGALLQPDAVLAGGALADGVYGCRLVRVGAKNAGNMAFASSGPLTCRVSADGRLQQLVMLGGVQRQMGLVFPGDPVRQVFLGTLMLPGEDRAMQYGADENRDVAGYVEQIAPQRWRLIMPAPHFDSRLAVLELVPAPMGVR